MRYELESEILIWIFLLFVQLVLLLDVNRNWLETSLLMRKKLHLLLCLRIWPVLLHLD